MRNQSLKQIALAVTACLLWSTAFAGVKIGLQYARPYFFASIRFIISGLLLFPFWMRGKNIISIFKQHKKTIGFVTLFQTFLCHGFFYSGIPLIPSALGAIVIGASPLFAAVTAHLYTQDDKMTRLKISSIAWGLLGIVIISLSRHPWTPAGLKEFLGICLVAAASISSALGNVFVSRSKKDINPVFINSIQLFLGGSGLLLLSVILEGVPQVQLSVPFLLVLGWLATLSAIALTLWFTLLKIPNTKISEVNLWKFLIPVFGAVFSWIVMPTESPELFTIIGMICVASSIVFYYGIQAKVQLNLKISKKDS